MSPDPAPLRRIVAGLRGPDGRPLRGHEQARWLARVLDDRIRCCLVFPDPAAMLRVAVSAHNLALEDARPARWSPTWQLLDRYRGVIHDVEAIALMVGYLREAAAQGEMLCHGGLSQFFRSRIGPPPSDADDASPAGRP